MYPQPSGRQLETVIAYDLVRRTGDKNRQAGFARQRMRTEGGRCRRDNFRALAQRVEVDATEVRIIGSKKVLVPRLIAAESAKTVGFGVPSLIRNGAPRSMKMGTIVSPWRYDAVAC